MTQPPPPPSATKTQARDKAEVRYIASKHRALLICLLVYLIAVVVRMFSPPASGHGLTIGVFAIGVVTAVFVFQLGIKLYGTATGVVLGILMLIPLLGLIVLLAISIKATAILRKNGLEVGLLGAKVPPEWSQTDGQ